ncbi:hypothetical protein EG329_011409 [Mollisiaceae sp. DMI_Dod_QoI]|nr:hypothetical protein EG329_011409 [Helotiales sp. DMI_Dod_QoI]
MADLPLRLRVEEPSFDSTAAAAPLSPNSSALEAPNQPEEKSVEENSVPSTSTAFTNNPNAMSSAQVNPTDSPKRASVPLSPAQKDVEPTTPHKRNASDLQDPSSTESTIVVQTASAASPSTPPSGNPFREGKVIVRVNSKDKSAASSSRVKKHLQTSPTPTTRVTRQRAALLKKMESMEQEQSMATTTPAAAASTSFSTEPKMSDPKMPKSKVLKSKVLKSKVLKSKVLKSKVTKSKVRKSKAPEPKVPEPPKEPEPEPKTIYNPEATHNSIRVYIGKVDPEYKEPLPQWGATSAAKWEAEKDELRKQGAKELAKEEWKETKNTFFYYQWTTRGPGGEKMRQWVLHKEVKSTRGAYNTRG